MVADVQHERPASAIVTAGRRTLERGKTGDRPGAPDLQTARHGAQLARSLGERCLGAQVRKIHEPVAHGGFAHTSAGIAKSCNPLWQRLWAGLLFTCLPALGAALFWFAVSHEDARAALKETCAFVQRQSVEHAKARDPPQELLDAIHASWKEGLLPKAVTKEPKTLKRYTVCGFELSRQALSLKRLRIAEASVRL